MAILILPARAYANMLEQAVGTRSLKIRRQVQQLRAKKRAENITRINLTQEDASILTGLIYEELHKCWVENDDREGLRDLLDSYVDMELGTEPPAIVYSMSEWKAVTEIASGLDSKIDLERHGAWNIYFQIGDIHHAVYPYIRQMIGKAHGVVNEDVEIPATEPKEGDTRYNHLKNQPEKFVNGDWMVLETLHEEFASKFGVIADSPENADEDRNQTDGNDG